MRFKPFLVSAALGPILISPVLGADEIIVTGERRAQEARTAPASVALIDGEEIARIDADHASEILNRAPGVLIHRNNGQEHLTAIRSPVLTAGAGAGSFLFLENGVPLRSAGFANVNALFEAHSEIAGRVEIVRGPGGAVYGANAIHGVVNVISPEPAEALSGRLSVSGDTTERFKGSAVISGGKDGHGFLAGLSLLSEHGWREDAGVDQQKATVRHDYAAGPWSVSSVFSFNNLNQETAGFAAGPDAYKDRETRRENPNPEAFRDARAARLSSRIDYQASDDLVLSVTPFARWTEMSFLMHFVPSQALEENDHWSVGAQSAAYWDPNAQLSVIAGLDVERTVGRLSEVQSIPTVFSYTQGTHYDYRVEALSVSPFVQASYEIAPRVTAVAGARLDHTRYDYDNRTDDGIVGRFLRPEDRVDSFTTASPKASLLYDGGDWTAYANYARGARPPQTTDLYRLQINETVGAAQPERIDSAELGWRSALGARIDLDLAAYYMDKKNFYFRDADGFNVADGRTRHVGVEADLTARLPAHVTLDMNASYAVHTYRFDRPVLSLPQASEAITKGDDVDTAPRWLAGARALWAPPELPVSFEAEWVFVGDYYMDAANSVIYPGHNLLNLRGAWRVGDNLVLSASLRNALDALYAERADYAFGEERYFPGEPRVLSLGLTARL